MRRQYPQSYEEGRSAKMVVGSLMGLLLSVAAHEMGVVVAACITNVFVAWEVR